MKKTCYFIIIMNRKFEPFTHLGCEIIPSGNCGLKDSLSIGKRYFYYVLMEIIQDRCEENSQIGIFDQNASKRAYLLFHLL
ncbi:hypothetical protein NPIL_538821 [Nephila pilipes]|uniref:Uncharacterized protein n=1 Tax=Nephila pilipes TaxID=299642 RepID=A0A8X6N2G5_NEPPI|nr:hypothetical protein NPIL_538821 [Nephila pilipes]